MKMNGLTKVVPVVFCVVALACLFGTQALAASVYGKAKWSSFGIYCSEEFAFHLEAVRGKAFAAKGGVADNQYADNKILDADDQSLETFTKCS